MVGAFWEIGVCSLSISGTVGLRLGRIDFQGRRVVTVMRFVYITIAYIAIVYIALVILEVVFSRIVGIILGVVHWCIGLRIVV
jgi:hypothetical protein